MRNLLFLLILVSIGLTTPALADGRRGDRQHNEQRVEHNAREYARHDRGTRHGQFQQRMNHLRRDLRQERRVNRRLVRRVVRRDLRQERRVNRRLERRVVRRELRHERHDWRRPLPVVTYHQAYRPRIFSNLVVRIPLFW
ncbi:hypothetical protein [Geopsychrobacter electrodiphilus]|uniref:hypothetical protein n=1 Tax=Geopsychrobacter electrodiphilus TaxID=225196 RepID=UPI000377E985|nr:hypothetical protein [Geopsychrobacter electrodiphilus]